MTTRPIPPPPGDPRHGQRYIYTHYRCRCDLCREANRIVCVEQQKKRLRQPLAPDDPRHGDPSTYANWGCRCKPCTKAQMERCKPYKKKYESTHREVIAERKRQRRATRPKLPPGDPRHGSSAGYNYWQCRCAACRAFGAADNRARYERRKLRDAQ